MATKRFGVIGLGNWGRLHARVYADEPGAVLAGLCDLDLGRAAAAGEELGVAGVFTDYRDLLADPAIDAVSVALPDFLHREVAVAASRAGKAVLLEKPLATTEEDARAIVAAAEAGPAPLMVDFHNRWSPPFQALKAALDDGTLGEPHLIAYRLNDTRFVPTKMLPWAARSSAAWFLASHCLDTLLWLRDARAGGDRIARLRCVTRTRLLKERYGLDVPDFHLTTLEWESGLVVQLENGWILPEADPSVFEVRCRVLGSDGSFTIDGSHHGAATLIADRVTHPDTMVHPHVFGRPTGFAAESIRHFARCVLTGTRPRVDARDGLAATRLVLAMEASARTGDAVAVGDLWAD